MSKFHFCGRGLSIAEPYPALFLAGLKHYETRSRRTAYRGPVVVCATRKPWSVPERFRDTALDLNPGRAVFVADLTECVEITPDFIATLDPDEIAAGFYSAGRYAWRLENIRAIKPEHVRGYPALWNIESDFETR